MNEDLTTDPTAAVLQHKDQIKTYLSNHIHPFSKTNLAWAVAIGELSVQGASDDQVGDYTALTSTATLTPPISEPTTIFSFKYDVVVREVTTHIVLVSAKQEWSDGIVTDNTTKEVGVIQLDSSSNTISPLAINIDHGGLWADFLQMIELGMTHIREGTDHLLFLLTLLLPAPLLVAAHRWKKFGGTKKSLIRILKIATAFTIGHSVTLIVSTLLHPNIPSWPIEALIAVSIVVSAIHALRPIFPGKEVFIVAGFGLIHGMAFSFTLAELDLTTSQLIVSLLGFNIGIELMQLIIICITMPSLIFLATTNLYAPIRIGGALLALIAAIGWVVERVGQPNPISALANSLSAYAVWLIVALGALAFGILIIRFYYTRSTPEDTLS